MQTSENTITTVTIPRMESIKANKKVLQDEHTCQEQKKLAERAAAVEAHDIHQMTSFFDNFRKHRFPCDFLYLLDPTKYEKAIANKGFLVKRTGSYGFNNEFHTSTESLQVCVPGLE